MVRVVFGSDYLPFEKEIKKCLCKNSQKLFFEYREEKEQKKMIRSAELLHEALPGGCLEKKTGLYHGEYSINHPERYVKELLENIIQ